MFRRYLVALVALLCMCQAPGFDACFAQAQVEEKGYDNPEDEAAEEDDADVYICEGNVGYIDIAAQSITVSDTVVYITPSTRIVRQVESIGPMETIRFSDISRGDYVNINHYYDRSGKVVAESVEVVPFKKGKRF